MLKATGVITEVVTPKGTTKIAEPTFPTYKNHSNRLKFKSIDHFLYERSISLNMFKNMKDFYEKGSWFEEYSRIAAVCKKDFTVIYIFFFIKT